MIATPSPKQLANYLRQLADKLDVNGGRAMELSSLLASRGYPTSTTGNGSRSSDTTSFTERAALEAVLAEDATDWTEDDRRMHQGMRLLWRAGLAVEASVDKTLAHATTADQLPPGTGFCTCSGDTEENNPYWCGTFCAPRQNGSSDRLVSGLAPTCYKRYQRWRDHNPNGTVADWKHETRRAREVRDEKARQLAADLATIRS